MKRVVCLLLAAWMIGVAVCTAAAKDRDMTYSLTVDDFSIRDPFVLLDGGLYYMYGTCATDKPGYGCFVSEDLKHWAGPFNVFTADDGFDGADNFWAPECHRYGGAYYLFATYRSRTTGRRGVSVFRAASPMGPFSEISDGHVTPHGQDCIDGTLYVEDGRPYMIYVREWTGTDDGVGRMTAAALSDDLSHFIAKPRDLFRADDPAWKPRRVTDGPVLYKSRTGKLLMLWSNVSKDGYCVGIAAANRLHGLWRQQYARLYAKDDKRHELDGGHGMLFKDKDGRLLLCIHSPNGGASAHAVFLPVRDLGYTLALDERPTLQTALLRALDRLTALLS